MYKVLLLGCDGNAGKNYAKSLKKDLGVGVKIYGTGLNRYQLLAAENSGLFEEVFNYSDFSEEEKFHEIMNHLSWKIDFIHAQPEEEVKFLCEYFGTHPGLKRYVFGKNIVEQSFYSNKNEVSKTLGNEVYMYDEVYDDPRAIVDLMELGDGYAWIRSNVGSGSRYALPINHTDDAEAWATYLFNAGKIEGRGDLTISSYLPGDEFAVQFFYIDGRLYHAQQRQRIEHHFARQMISGQSSTPSVAKTTNREDVYNSAFHAIRECSEHLDVVPNGIYGVDIRCNINGEPVVTEVNYGRYFTTSDFFATFGVNTPVAELEWAVDRIEPEKRIQHLRDGIYWIRALDSEPVWYNEEDIRS